ncbi:hypothetical protein [Endozoicomonas sp.]|uniref:hypothetical protein n=1 Tax=Endozoicomonas sp. TaxID=1892382 RepID=UPI00383BC55F
MANTNISNTIKACPLPSEITTGKSNAKSDDKVKYTNQSGITFTVHIVPQQMIKNKCLICHEVAIVANPICLEDRHHVVCQVCAPKILDNKNTRCPQCNVSNTKATYDHVSKESKHYLRELNNTKISCDSCEYTGDFSSINSHTHGNEPSPSPFWPPPAPAKTSYNIPEQKLHPAVNTTFEDSEIRTERIVDSLFEQLKDTDILEKCESLCITLGLNASDLKEVRTETSAKIASGRCQYSGPFLTYFKLLLKKCFSIRNTRAGLPPMNLQLCKIAVRWTGLRCEEIAQSLSWPE